MCKALGAQMGRNAEAYIDDIVIKTRESHTFIEDLEETFINLRKVNIKLNPAKCAFGVPLGKLLGFLVSHRGIEANPDKVKAIEEMRPPRNLKEMQHLIVKGDSQLVVNFLNKSYTPKDEHMAAYLEELRKMEKRF
jgi:hypothetical protein